MIQGIIIIEIFVHHRFQAFINLHIAESGGELGDLVFKIVIETGLIVIYIQFIKITYRLIYLVVIIYFQLFHPFVLFDLLY